MRGLCRARRIVWAMGATVTLGIAAMARSLAAAAPAATTANAITGDGAAAVTRAVARSAFDRLDTIRRKGHLTCGVNPEVAGFATVDRNGHYHGLDVDICRALSAAIFGTPDKVVYALALRVEDFRRTPDIDIVSRRLTWELQREASLGLLFGPIMFYDGQGFLVSKQAAGDGVPTQREPRSLADPRARADQQSLSNLPVCVVAGGTAEANLTSYGSARGMAFNKIPLKSLSEAGAALTSGRCSALTADVSELGAFRSKLPDPAAFGILGERISREPLAQLLRQDDVRLFDVLRWTVFALIGAEELGIDSENVDTMLASGDPAVQRLLGVIPGNGKALGLDEKWAYHIIKTLGNYGEMFDRNVGRGSPIGLDRGLNNLSTAGGLMVAPPLR
jgi:general L-amino acid transport system substrate-binding protein